MDSHRKPRKENRERRNLIRCDLQRIIYVESTTKAKRRNTHSTILSLEVFWNRLQSHFVERSVSASNDCVSLERQLRLDR